MVTAIGITHLIATNVKPTFCTSVTPLSTKILNKLSLKMVKNWKNMDGFRLSIFKSKIENNSEKKVEKDKIY